MIMKLHNVIQVRPLSESLIMHRNIIHLFLISSMTLPIQLSFKYLRRDNFEQNYAILDFIFEFRYCEKLYLYGPTISIKDQRETEI